MKSIRNMLRSLRGGQTRRRDEIRVKITTNWCDDARIREAFNRCTKRGDYLWNTLFLVPEEEMDYDSIVVINHARYPVDRSKAILLDAETKETRARWAERNGSPEEYFYHFSTEMHHTLDKWYVERTYQQLLEYPTKTRVLSGIISGKQVLEGHQERYRFCESYLDRLPEYDHYAREVLPFVSYRGALADKADGLLPYKYTVNVENNRERNYITEKLLDGILCETLTFYDGAPNAGEHIDPRCFIPIDVRKPEKALAIIQKAIANDEWEKRLPYLREEKQRLMNERNPLNIIERILNGEMG